MREVVSTLWENYGTNCINGEHFGSIFIVLCLLSDRKYKKGLKNVNITTYLFRGADHAQFPTSHADTVRYVQINTYQEQYGCASSRHRSIISQLKLFTVDEF